jgi:Leucine-rich repeat (LRR) protein
MRIRKCGIHYLPAEMAKMNNLKELRITLCPLHELPLKRMVEEEREAFTDPTGRKELRKLESSIHNGQQQQCMYRLEYLELNRTKIWEISFPEGVCPNLKHLHIEDCNDLVEVGELPPTLLTLKLVGCSQLRAIQGLCCLTKLQELDIGYCKEVEELPSLERLISLENLEVNRCGKLKESRG